MSATNDSLVCTWWLPSVHSHPVLALVPLSSWLSHLLQTSMGIECAFQDHSQLTDRCNTVWTTDSPTASANGASVQLPSTAHRG